MAMLTIHKAAPNGSILVTYTGWLVAENDAITVLTRWLRPSLPTPYVTFANRDLLFERFYRQRPYNIFALHDGGALPPDIDLARLAELLWGSERPSDVLSAHSRQLCSLLDASCPLKGHYVNFTYPVEYDARRKVLLWRDLALDLWVPAHGRPLLLDSEDYEALALAEQDPALHAQIQEALAQLWPHALARTGPFSPSSS